MPRHELGGVIDGPASYVRARSLEHAIELLAGGNSAHVLAGGTVVAPEVALLGFSGTFVDLGQLRELATISGDSERGAKLGALVRNEQLLTAPELAGYTALKQAAHSIGNPHVRRAGTVGGNIALRLPTTSLPPALLVLDAMVELTNNAALRLPKTIENADSPIGLSSPADPDLSTFPAAAIKKDHFFSLSIDKVLEQGLPPGALITAIHIPPNDGRRSAYHKYAGRHATARAIASVAISAKFDRATITDARVAVGGLCRPIRLPKTEAALNARDDDEKIAELAATEAPYEQHGKPPPENQRRRLIRAAIRRLLKELRNP
jgi:CO/xanthine dehydrogenase FAD-binding subunit